jgi:hypothetical protein
MCHRLYQAGPHCGSSWAKALEPQVLPCHRLYQAGPHCGDEDFNRTIMQESCHRLYQAGPHCGIYNLVRIYNSVACHRLYQAGPHCGDVQDPDGNWYSPCHRLYQAGPHCGAYGQRGGNARSPGVTGSTRPVPIAASAHWTSVQPGLLMRIAGGGRPGVLPGTMVGGCDRGFCVGECFGLQGLGTAKPSLHARSTGRTTYRYLFVPNYGRGPGRLWSALLGRALP